MSMHGRAEPLAAYRGSVNATAKCLSSRKESMLPTAKSVACKVKWTSTGAKPIASHGKSISLLRNLLPVFAKRLSSVAESIAHRTISVTALPKGRRVSLNRNTLRLRPSTRPKVGIAQDCATHLHGRSPSSSMFYRVENGLLHAGAWHFTTWSEQPGFNTAFGLQGRKNLCRATIYCGPTRETFPPELAQPGWMARDIRPLYP